MKRILLSVSMVASMCVSLALAPLAQSQEHYESGSFWAVTSVETKPGMFDAYMEDLDGLWRRQMDMMKEAGKIKNYMMFSNVHARQGEPDLWLFVEWTSAGAMMDTTWEEWEAMTEKLVGSMDKSRQLSIKRGDLRTLMSDVLLREVKFR